MPTNIMVSHMTAPSATSFSSTISSNQSKPKIGFSIDSIVGRNSSRPTNDCFSERESPRSSAQHKPRHSPVSCVRSESPPIITSRLSEWSTHLNQQLSPSNRSATNISPMSTPSPISMANGTAVSPYLESGRVNPLTHQSHSCQQLPLGPSAMPPAMAHSMMMAAAHHMSPIPQPYHQPVSLYPWHLRANPFVNRYHGMPLDGGLSSFHLSPFRKPKRIRTAFSPSQLLKLEEVFEKNNYVVGSERKQLASGLGLSETQIKVWFQNRRTKHKRQKQEEGGGSGSGHSNDGHNKYDKSCEESDEEE